MSRLSRRYLIFAAHPDDPDLLFGGTACRLIAAGHQVRFVSVTNGNAGHQSMAPIELAARRKREAEASARIAGLEYLILDNDDGRLEPTLEVRRAIIRQIREFHPDVVVSHRTCDYHADHRATGQLVQDASFLAAVPLCYPEFPVPDRLNPVYAFSFDTFQSPRPFRPDAAVAIDDVMEKKLAMVACHESQFFEWLPWIEGDRGFDAARLDAAGRREHLMRGWLCRNQRQAELVRTLPVGAECGIAPETGFAELFEQSEYGRKVTRQEFQALFRP